MPGGGQIERRSRQQGESFHRGRGRLHRLLAAVHVDQLPDDGRPGLPEIPARLQPLAEDLQQALRFQRSAGHLAERQQPLPEDDLIDQLIVDELERLLSLRLRAAQLHQLVERRLVIDRQLQGPPAALPGPVRLVLSLVDDCADEVSDRVGLVGGDGRAGFGHRFLEPLLLRKHNGQLTTGPGVLGVQPEELADFGLFAGQIVLRECLDQAHAQPVVKRVTIDQGAEVLFGGLRALEVVDHAGDQIVHVLMERGGFEDLSTVLKCLGKIVADPGAIGHRLQPRQGMAAILGLIEQSGRLLVPIEPAVVSRGQDHQFAVVRA